MKTLNTYINEWRANTNTVSSIKKQQYFVYKINETKKIKIFNHDWPQFKKYKDKVYINGEHASIDNNGNSIRLNPGTYYVEIKDIDNVTNCYSMFFNCLDLIKVPFFDTSKVKTMEEMFSYCENLKDVPPFNISNVKNMFNMFSDCYELEDVPLFNTSKVENMRYMFDKCKNLSDKTKQDWSTVYDFKKHCKIEKP